MDLQENLKVQEWINANPTAYMLFEEMVMATRSQGKDSVCGKLKQLLSDLRDEDPTFFPFEPALLDLDALAGHIYERFAAA